MLFSQRVSLVPRLAPAIALILFGWAGPAASQSIGDVSIAAGIGTMSMDADFVDGSQLLFSVSASLPLTSFLDLEGEFARSCRFTRRYEGPSTSFAPPGSSRDEIERLAVLTRFDHRRDSRWLGSIGVTFHPALPRRVEPRLFVGVTGHQVVDQTELQTLRLPPGVSQEQVDRIMPTNQPWSRNVGGLTIGGSVRIGLSQHLWVAPDVRYDYGSIGDEINNALRTTMRVGWRF
jgi:hypothetical protein